jgi:hypothetical protein
MSVLPGVLGCRLLRRTRSGTPRNQHPAVARWPAHLHGLATAIHEISGFEHLIIMESIELFCKTPLLWFCWNLLGCHNDRAGPARENSSTKLHIRINWTPAHGPLQQLTVSAFCEHSKQLITHETTEQLLRFV